MTMSERTRRAIPLALTRRGLALLGLAATIAAAWALVRLRDLLALVALAVAALVVALLALLLTRALARARAEISSDVLTPAVGETVTVVAAVRHRLPVSQSAALEWRGPGGSRVLPLVLPRGGEARQAVQWATERRGPLAMGVEALVVTDPLGLARIRIPLGARTEVLVLPLLLPADRLPRELSGRGAGRAAASETVPGALSGAGRGASGAEEAGGVLREYRAGDPPRRVHWKQSARQDRLLVNVPEHGAGERLVTALVVTAAAYPGRPADFEHAVSLVATLVARQAGLAGRVGPAGRTGLTGRMGPTGRMGQTGRTGPTGRAGPGGLLGGGRGGAVALCTVGDGGSGPRIERTASSAAEALRALARVEPTGDPVRGSASAPLPEGSSPAFRPTVIVTGILTAEAVVLAGRSPAGTVVVVSPPGAGASGAPGAPGARAALPSGWDVVHAPPFAAAERGARHE